MDKVRYPFDSAQVITLDSAEEMAETHTVSDTKTIIEVSSLTQNETLNLSVDDEIITGAELIIRVTQGATGRDVALGTGFDTSAPDLTGVANDVDTIELWYDGTSFVPKTAAWVKIVDAA